MSEKITFRTKTVAEDIGSIRKLVKETGFFRSDEVDIAAELVEESVKKGEKSGYHFIIAEVKNQVIGYTCYGPIPCSLLSWDLYWIVTERTWQGKGIGSRLLKMTENNIKASGGKNIVIETSSKELYAPTQHFYDKNGYHLKARFEDFYDAGDDKLVFMKKMQEEVFRI